MCTGHAHGYDGPQLAQVNLKTNLHMIWNIYLKIYIYIRVFSCRVCFLRLVSSNRVTLRFSVVHVRLSHPNWLGDPFWYARPKSFISSPIVPRTFLWTSPCGCAGSYDVCEDSAAGHVLYFLQIHAHSTQFVSLPSIDIKHNAWLDFMLYPIYYKLI